MGKNVVCTTLDMLTRKTLNIGYAGENLHTQVIINCTSVFWDYPNATWTATVQPPAGAQYSLTLTRETDTDNLVWDVTSTDLSQPGGGQFQITFTYDGEVIKSAIGAFTVNRSL